MSSEALEFTTVVLSGPATLYEVAGLRELLNSAMTERKDLRIDLGTAGPWDLSGVQLLISATATGRRTGQSVWLTNVPRACVEMADRAGLSAWLAAATESFMT